MKLFICTLLSFVFGFTAQAQNWSTIDSLLSNNISSYQGNVVVMIGKNDSLIYYKNYGSFDSLTVRPIASLTKSLSGAVLLKLAQNNIINLNDSIGKYIPLATTLGKGSSTLRQNFTHTAGWNGSSGSLFLSMSGLTLMQSADSIITYDPLVYTPSTKFKYTGVSMQVAAAAIEAATSQSWNSLWVDSLKTPLGLSNTFFLNNVNPRVAGGLLSNAKDIFQFAKFIAQDGKNEQGIQVIDSLWMQELWKDQTNNVPVISMPYPYSPQYNNPYLADTIRYSLGCWQDIYNPNQSYQEQISGGGAFGSLFWVNRCNNTYGVIFTKSNYKTTWQTSFQVIDVVNSIHPNTCYNPLGLNKIEHDINSINIYPNPTKGTFTIGSEINYQKIEISIFSITGQILLTSKNETEIDISHLPIGCYTISINIDGNIKVKKILKIE